jgi:hypothetical protein
MQGSALGPVCVREERWAAIECATVRVVCPGQPNVVGLAGLEPAASSLSAIKGSPLCGPAFPQVAADRQRRSNAF